MCIAWTYAQALGICHQRCPVRFGVVTVKLCSRMALARGFPRPSSPTRLFVSTSAPLSLQARRGIRRCEMGVLIWGFGRIPTSAVRSAH